MEWRLSKLLGKYCAREVSKGNGPVNNPSEVGIIPPQKVFSEMGIFVPGRHRPQEISGFRLEQAFDTDGKQGWRFVPVAETPINRIRVNPHGGGNEEVCGGTSRDARRTVRKDRRLGRI